MPSLICRHSASASGRKPVRQQFRHGGDDLNVDIVSRHIFDAAIGVPTSGINDTKHLAADHYCGPVAAFCARSRARADCVPPPGGCGVERNGYGYRWPRPRRFLGICPAPHQFPAIFPARSAMLLYKQVGLFLLWMQSKNRLHGFATLAQRTAKARGESRSRQGAKAEIVGTDRKHRNRRRGPGRRPGRRGAARPRLSGRDHDARRRTPPAL